MCCTAAKKGQGEEPGCCVQIKGEQKKKTGEKRGASCKGEENTGKRELGEFLCDKNVHCVKNTWFCCMNVD